jgi:hypothetical protein
MWLVFDGFYEFISDINTTNLLEKDRYNNEKQ